jgi:hypothetical protein
MKYISFIICLLFLTSCSPSTTTPHPTHTPWPTWTPWPTYTPWPIHTPIIEEFSDIEFIKNANLDLKGDWRCQVDVISNSVLRAELEQRMYFDGVGAGNNTMIYDIEDQSGPHLFIYRFIDENTIEITWSLLVNPIKYKFYLTESYLSFKNENVYECIKRE